MTLKEAKTVFLNRGFIEVDGGTIFDGNAWRNAVLVISDWFKAEPCEDAVSRQMVKEQMIKYGFHAPDMTVTEFVKDLSFVNSQQPCEDAISRADVLDLCDSKDTEYEVKHFREDVECLPSVYPQPKTGHWISVNTGKQSHTKDGMTIESVKCSECGEWLTASDEYACNGNFCPNCGCAMRGKLE